MFENKRKYQRDEIKKWSNKKNKITKKLFANKLGISRPTLDKLLKNYNKKDFTKFKRNKANNKIGDNVRKEIYIKTINFLTDINKHSEESISLSSFVTLKTYIGNDKRTSMRTF